MKHWYCILILILASSCKTLFNIQPQPIHAVVVKKGDSKVLLGASALNIDGYFVWGGSVIKGDDGKYHMLFSLWESGINYGSFVQSWVLESKIGYAVSDYPDRDFKFKKIILKGTRYNGDTTSWDAQMVHNPHIKKFNDTYYLYYVGAKDNGVQPKGSTAENLDKRSRVQQSICIGAIAFSSFEDLINGNFQRPKQPLLVPRTRVKASNILNGSPKGTIAKPDNIIMANPAVVFNPNTKDYMLFFKGNLYEPSWKGAHGVAIGKTPLGPFTPREEFVFDIRMPDGSIASTEDPYVWYVKNQKKFFAVVKDFSGRLTGEKKTLALLSSHNGLKWDMAQTPLFMNRNLQLTNGTKVTVDRLERPQLLIDKKGVPIVMYAACALENVNPKSDGSSFNVQISISNK